MDHVPPQAIFHKRDREPLKLPTHITCNSSYALLDEKLGQLIAMKYGEVPPDPSYHKLKFVPLGDVRGVALGNLDLPSAIWRWIAGFHAALYREGRRNSSAHRMGIARNAISAGQYF